MYNFGSDFTFQRVKQLDLIVAHLVSSVAIGDLEFKIAILLLVCCSLAMEIKVIIKWFMYYSTRCFDFSCKCIIVKFYFRPVVLKMLTFGL